MFSKCSPTVSHFFWTNPWRAKAFSGPIREDPNYFPVLLSNSVNCRVHLQMKQCKKKERKAVFCRQQVYTHFYLLPWRLSWYICDNISVQAVDWQQQQQVGWRPHWASRRWRRRLTSGWPRWGNRRSDSCVRPPTSTPGTSSCSRDTTRSSSCVTPSTKSRSHTALKIFFYIAGVGYLILQLLLEPVNWLLLGG